MKHAIPEETVKLQADGRRYLVRAAHDVLVEQAAQRYNPSNMRVWRRTFYRKAAREWWNDRYLSRSQFRDRARCREIRRQLQEAL